MSYTTTLQCVRTTGVGVKVVNESLGTGDGSTTSYDLDKGNVISGSYTLKYGVSGSNSFTELVETTDYSIDLSGGTVLLTSSGVSAISSKVLYADYTHSPKLGDAEIQSFFSAAERETDKKTNNYWGEPASFTEYFDGRASFEYPTTDRPYVHNDYDEPDGVQLKVKNIVSIDGVYFLNRGVNVAKQWSYDDTLASYTDNTSESNTMSGSGFNPLGSTIAAGDYCYVGASNRFHGLSVNLFTIGSTVNTNTIEYYNGSSWVAFSPTESTSGIINFESSGKLVWDPLSGWEKTTVNGGNSLYYIRFVSGGAYLTNPSVKNFIIDQNFIIGQEINLYQVAYDDWGRVVLLNNRFPNGTRNIRVDYTSGMATIDPLASELTALYVGLRIYANITGGSYDDATGFTLGRKTVSIGEVYVNVREVVRQFEVRINSLLDLIGRNQSISVI